MRKLLSVTLLAAMALYAQKGRPQRVVTFTAGGTGDAITGTPSPALAAYTDMSGAAPPLQACFIATAANTGATTINLNSLGAKSLFKFSGAINTALVANDIRVGQRVCFVYYAAGDAFQMLTPVGNAASGGSGGPVEVCSLVVAETNSAAGGDFPSITCNIGAGTLTAGDMIHIVGSGPATSDAAGTFTFDLKIGGTTVWIAPVTGAMDGTTTPNDLGWAVDLWVQVRTVGASGTMVAGGVVHVKDTPGDGQTFNFKTMLPRSTSVTRDTTAALAVKLSITFPDVADRDVTINTFRVTVE